MDKCGLSKNPTWPWEEILHFGNFQQSIDIQFVRAERDSTYTQETAQKHCCVITMLNCLMTQVLPCHCFMTHATIVDCHMPWPAMAGHVCGLYSRHIKKSFLSRRPVAEAATNFSKSFAFASVSPARCKRFKVVA